MEKEKGNIFKVMLALKEPSMLKDFCHIRHFEDLAGAKEECNASWGEDKKIMLLKPYQKRLNLLVMAGDSIDNFYDEFINKFDKTLRDGYGWKAYAEKGSGQLFEIKAVKKIKPYECLALLEDQKNYQQYFDQADCEVFLEECHMPSFQIIPRKRRYGENLEGSKITHLSLEEALARMEALQGMNDFKEEMRKVVALYHWLQELNRPEEIRSYIPFHYLFTYKNEGFGLSTTLEIMSSIFFHLGLIEDQLFWEVEDITDIFSRGRWIPEEMKGITAAKFSEEMMAESQRWIEKGGLREMIEKMDRRDDEGELVVLAFSTEEKGLDECLRRLLEEKGIPYRNLYFPDLSNEELISITRQRMKDLGFPTSPSWERELDGIFHEMRSRGSLRNLQTVDRVVNRMLSGFLEAQGNKKEKSEADIFLPELRSLARKVKSHQDEKGLNNPERELEDMVGLSSVKERVKELVYSFLVNKRKRQAGMEGEILSMHMVFSGNPGTGKTTVARIIGAIMEEKGLLEKGHLVEVTRKDLVGGYVGQTALKTASVIEKARGGILFIDEAYALDCEAKIDYGHEAVSTLVKYMEEYREEMVVILAGYTREMERMLQMNPGLAGRIPHKLYFPDYTPEELLLIFKNLLGEDYALTKEAEEIIMELLFKGKEKGGENFGNGRFARNLLERLKMKQSRRLLEENLEEKEDLRVLLPEDAQKLYTEEDFIKTRIPRIGFTRC